MFLKILTSVVMLLFVVVIVAWKTRSSLVVQKEFSTNIESLWTIWNDPNSIKKWWGPNGFSCPLAQNDLRVGGKYLLGMQQDGSEKIDYNVGTYKEIIPNKKIVSEISFSDANGNAILGSNVKLPGTWPDFVTVSFEFESSANDKTQVTITETGVPLIIKILAKMGWEQQLDKIEKLLK